MLTSPDIKSKTIAMMMRVPKVMIAEAVEREEIMEPTKDSKGMVVMTVLIAQAVVEASETRTSREETTAAALSTIEEEVGSANNMIKLEECKSAAPHSMMAQTLSPQKR